MSIKAALIWHLGLHVPLVNGRVFAAGHVPQDSLLPLIAVQRSDYKRERHQGGTAGLAQSTFDISCVAERDVDAAAVAEQVAALDRYRGDMGKTGSTTRVKIVTVEGDEDAPNQPIDGSDVGRFIVKPTAMIWHADDFQSVST